MISGLGLNRNILQWNPDLNKPLGFPANMFPDPQGQYYCSVGAANAFTVEILWKSTWMYAWMQALIWRGINAEVAAGQWEFQIFAKGAKAAGDQVWIARYLLERIGEKYGVVINWHCKPLGNLDWNGSGMHANFLILSSGLVEINIYMNRYVKHSDRS